MSNFEIKLVVVGAGGVGKSAITVYYVQRYFIEEYDPTIEDAYRKQIILDEVTFVVDILDTAGEEEYSAMRDQYMRSGEGFIVVYSITDKSSNEELVTYIEQILRVKDVDYIPMVIIGNKCDLESDRQVETQAGEIVAEIHKAAFFETSAKFGINIDEAIVALSKKIVQIRSIGNAKNKSEKKKPCVVC